MQRILQKHNDYRDRKPGELCTEYLDGPDGHRARASGTTTPTGTVTFRTGSKVLGTGIYVHRLDGTTTVGVSSVVTSTTTTLAANPATVRASEGAVTPTGTRRGITLRAAFLPSSMRLLF